MDIIFEKACEPSRWTVVFHRVAANRFFSIVAMGHFKHVSAFAWVPDVRKWVLYDPGFPLFRLGYCTSSIKHLLGLRGGALRPDALFRLCKANGGTVSDDENHRTASPATRSPAAADGRSANDGAAGRG